MLGAHGREAHPREAHPRHSKGSARVVHGCRRGICHFKVVLRNSAQYVG